MQRFPGKRTRACSRRSTEKDDFAVFYKIAIDALNKHQADVGFMRLLFYSALEEHELAERFFQRVCRPRLRVYRRIHRAAAAGWRVSRDEPADRRSRIYWE